VEPLVNCPRCQHDNPVGQKFCGECGARLALLCPACAKENPAGQKFCGECGAPLAPAASGKFTSPETYTPKHLAEKILTSKNALEGERKQVTVLFADMKGSMELLADRDPEEARKLLDAVIEHMMEAVHRYEGTVNHILGDGIMALFGAPIAHEDHAVRACYTALRMQESVKRYASEVQRTQGIPIQIRIGLNSGEVVVGSIKNDLHMDYTAIGQTAHLAARMEQMAMPGSILMTADALRLAEGYVQVKPLGPVNVKGLNEPIEVHEITGAGPVRSRLQAAAARGLSPFVGRSAEFETLTQALERAASSRGQIVALVGEPGVGKSRLFWEFTHSRRTIDWLILESGSVSYGKATAYLPVIDLLKAYFRIQDRDDVRQIKEKVTGKLLTLDRALEFTLPALLTLLNVEVDDEQWRNLDPFQRRLRTLEAVKRLFLRESLVHPLVGFFEDLHWIDSETQAVLDSLSETVPSARILLLVNYRPEYQHAWGAKTYYTQLRIDPLPPESADKLLTALLGDRAELQPLKRMLLDRTEGNPFFLEESVRTLAETKFLMGERGNYRLEKTIASTHVPATVQAVLAARIDRLAPEEKRLLQSAAVIGKDVPFTLLQAVADRPEEELRLSLTRLQSAEFLYEVNLFPELEYTFKHALTHEVAYGSILQERRRTLHTAIVDAIEKLYPDRLAEQVERLAHHALRSELWDKAVVYLYQAGRKATERSAYKEAASYFEQAAEALKSLPETRQTLEQAINIRVDLGPVLIAMTGFAAAEVKQTYSEARELCERLGETPQLFPVLWGLARIHDLRGELNVGRDLGEQLLIIAKRVQDPALLLEAHHELWANLFDSGELSTALTHTERGIELYSPQKHRQHAFLYGGHDPGVCGLRHAAMMLWLLGFPDHALRRSQQALALARELSHPFTLAFALYYSAWVHQQRGERQAVEQNIEATITLATEQELTRWTQQAAVLKGWLLIEHGKGQEGILHLRHGAKGSLAVRDQSHCATLLAEAYAKEGDTEEGLRVVTEELTRVELTGGRLYESELHRIKGELLLNRADPSEKQAEMCFREATNVSRQQAAKSLELRATMSLSRLWGRQNKRAQARELLAGVYNWFTEGFDTADLKAAKALLEELE
jgi:predicted ATPase/class 3 adenylate cyclase